jgi:hypothetical protein
LAGITTDTTVVLTKEEFKLIEKIENSQNYYKEAYGVHLERIALLESELKIYNQILELDSLESDLEAAIRTQNSFLIESIQQQKTDALKELKQALSLYKKEERRKRFWRNLAIGEGVIISIATLILII